MMSFSPHLIRVRIRMAMEPTEIIRIEQRTFHVVVIRMGTEIIHRHLHRPHPHRHRHHRRIMTIHR